jgi:hypothetical protein
MDRPDLHGYPLYRADLLIEEFDWTIGISRVFPVFSSNVHPRPDEPGAARQARGAL